MTVHVPFTISPSKLRVNFFHSLATSQWSGGNNFLSILRQYLEDQKIYASQRTATSSILVDSYHDVLSALTYKLFHPHVYFIYRFGPIFQLHRSSAWNYIDNSMILAANYAADFVIFQSNWSLQKAQSLGFIGTTPHRVIYNGVDTTIFKQSPHALAPKIKLIATSWSHNKNKGFDYFKYLDDHLDLAKYEMLFIGNSPVEFKNIRSLPPVPPKKLAALLTENDIYIAAMKDDACSNALLEALACGLPVVALQSGANAELVATGGTLFTSTHDLIPALEKTQHNYATLQKNIKARTIQEAGEAYIQAIQMAQKNPARKLSLLPYCKALMLFITFLIRR